MDLNKIAQKWQERWDKEKAFEAIPDKRKKFFGTFPYPYINAYPHIGHLFTFARVESLARYKRLQGYNVLFPQGWHITGSPIVQAAKRVKNNEEKQIKIMKDMGFSDQEIKKFEDPKHWIDFFAPEFKKDFQSLGMSIDWRREFVTTDMNPHYNKFIHWQFNKLKEKEYVVKGRFPVVWDPKEDSPVGDHDRIEGEGETPKDFIWIKFHLKDSDLILVVGTTRPDALLGQTHLWIDPDATYKIAEVNGEKWVVGEKALQKIKDQYVEPKVTGEIKSKELIGKWVQGPLVDYPLYIVPAWFIDADVGSGLVYSALEDPVDLIEVQDLQNDPKRIEEYGLDQKIIAKLKPISIIDVPGMGENLGQEMIDKYKITSPKEKKKVKDAKDELNKTVFRSGVMKKNCGKYADLPVPQAQEKIKKDLIDNNDAVMFYELTGKVVSRSLTECIVKIVSDQWFIDYGNEEWKKITHKCLDKLTLYPEKVRQQFNYVLDWLHAWACTREEGLGSRLPWDEKWLIESLSDSTIYMAYYTFVHILKEIPQEKVDDALFDFILLGKDVELKCDKAKAEEMRKEFEYWYPLDFRNSGKDLVQNHLSFFLFNHTAIFPEKYWPQSIGVNGWVTVDGQKMSKSLGNMIPAREVVKKYGPDVVRTTMLSGGEGMDDPNWDTKLADSLASKFEQLEQFIEEHYNKGREEALEIDAWMESQLHKTIHEAEEAMEETLFRTAIQKSLFDIPRHLRWYLRRCENKPQKALMKQVLEAQLIMLSPFAPHVCEELWEKMGHEGLISLAAWPKVDKKKIETEDTESYLRTTMNDVTQVMKLSKIDKPKSIKIIIAAPWKYKFFQVLKKELEKTRNPKEIIDAVMKTDLKQHSKITMKLIPKIVKAGAVPSHAPRELEEKGFSEAISFLEKEFKSSVELLFEESSKEAKAQQALPGKPAIMLE